MRETINTKKINLIPSDLVVPIKTKSLKNLFIKLNVILSVIAVFSLFVFLGLYFYLSTDLGSLNLSTNDLKKEIVLLEGNEQKLILIRDKLVKVNKVKSLPNSNKNLAIFEDLDLQLQNNADIRFAEVKISPSKLEIAVKMTTSDSLLYFFDVIKNIKNYKSITLLTLNYTPIKGFTASVIFNN